MGGYRPPKLSVLQTFNCYSSLLNSTRGLNRPARGAEHTAADDGKHAGSFIFACEELIGGAGDCRTGNLRGESAGALSRVADDGQHAGSFGVKPRSLATAGGGI